MVTLLSVTYTGPPVLLMPPQDMTVVTGSTVKLSCSFLANPNNVQIYWQRNGKRLSSDQILANATLILRNATDQDAGEYRCTVSNSIGSVTASAQLIVLGKLTVCKR